MTTSFLTYLLDQGCVTPDHVDAHRHATDSPQSWIGQLMLNHGLIGVEQINEVLRRQDIHRGFFGENAIALGYVTKAQVEALLASQEVRRNAELLETLSLAGCLDMRDGLAALCRFHLHRLANSAAARTPHVRSSRRAGIVSEPPREPSVRTGAATHRA